MEATRWIIAGLLIAMSLFVAFSQWMAMIAAARRLKADPEAGGYSMVPLVGGLLGTIGMLIAPTPYLQWLWWLPLIFDPGCALMFGAVAVFGVAQLVRRFTGPTT